MLSLGQKTPIGVGVSHLGTFIRTGGGHQVTYEGVPLYTFTGDLKPHQVNGNNVIDSWGHWWAINRAVRRHRQQRRGPTRRRPRPRRGTATNGA